MNHLLLRGLYPGLGLGRKSELEGALTDDLNQGFSLYLEVPIFMDLIHGNLDTHIKTEAVWVHAANKKIIRLTLIGNS